MVESENGMRERVARIEVTVNHLDKQVGELRGLVKWIAIAIGGAILAAVMKFILEGGLTIGGGL
jgi:hypothetical protein